MGPVNCEPEIQFAQRLACNEKPARTRAIKKLKKYIIYRSQNVNGGFTGDELLKLWKGLFYCLWMQDKPLLQEELSEQISGLVHLFQNVESQFLFLEAFLQTFNREWNGIDRLRMDKFFQLVRFVFRHTFELLKKKNWDQSLVTRFLELLTSKVLQTSSGSPCGLQFHIMDVYVAELSKVGSAELTADQNLMLIDPFCITAAKTKNRILFKAICSSIFSTIIDQAPFAIEELISEMNAAGEDSDSGQASQEEEEEKVLKGVEVNSKGKGSKTATKKGKHKRAKQANGTISREETSDDDDEHLSSENDTMFPDEGCGPVLQFDYSALADRLFTLAKRAKTPNFNRKSLYHIIRVLRGLSEGEFPRNEYPEEVSTDEDDDEMFGSRKRMKRGLGFGLDDGPVAKKGKQKEGSKSKTRPAEDESKLTNATPKKKRKSRKKKKVVGGDDVSTKQTEGSEVNVSVTISVAGLDTPAQSSHTVESETKDAVESKEFTKTDTQSPPLDADASAPPEETKTEKIEDETSSAVVKDQSQTPLLKNTCTKKAKKRKVSTFDTVGPEPCEEVVVVGVDLTKTISEKITPTIKGKSKKQVLTLQNNTEVKIDKTAEAVGGAETKVKVASGGEELPLADSSPVPIKNKKRTPKKQVKRTQADETEDVKVLQCVEAGTKPLEEAVLSTPLPKKTNQPKASRRAQKAKNEEQPGQAREAEASMSIGKKKRKPKLLAQDVEMVDPQSEVAAEDKMATDIRRLSSSKKDKNKRRKSKGIADVEAEEANLVEIIPIINDPANEYTGVKANVGESIEVSAIDVKIPLKKKAAAGSSGLITFQSRPNIPTPLFCKVKGSPSTPLSSKKKCLTPGSDSKKVTFGLRNNKTAEFRKNDRSLLVSPDGSSRVPFDPQQKPRFGVLKSPARFLNSGTKIKKTTPKGRPTAADFF